MAKKAGRPMSLEECAARMTAFLNRCPRSKKTRAYLETLPKRKRKAVVTAADYQPLGARFLLYKSEPIIALDTTGKEIARFARKDRLRPKVRCSEQPEAINRQVMPSRWECRPDGQRFHAGRRTGVKLFRIGAVTMAQRFMLYAAQEGICGLCGGGMEGSAFSFSLDHVIPLSLDGRDGLGNLLLCHGECNGRKTNDAPTGCELIWLLNVNARLGAQPQVF